MKMSVEVKNPMTLEDIGHEVVGSTRAMGMVVIVTIVLFVFTIVAVVI